ncbi:uncharacterized protein EV154DRAFT_608242 [Mucor mucedo]|uniref:uncharacterized protein n=1 Tax=Mucor mucedo TaxID=29922 RepID=UPI00221F35C3|nr:uncharacterized protein EV154DRAFT_608242 [Mucor mucedo]KAI7865059.1 hypothetical protein EV154DRAFT_608242 [Mucor mucedo]
MVDSLKTAINTLTETISKIPQVVTMAVSVALSNGNREAMSTKRTTITGSNIVHALQSKKTTNAGSGSALQEPSDTMMRKIGLMVSMEETEKYFRSLANEDDFDLLNQEKRDAMFKKKAELAYNNTFHITGTFLSVYFASNYGVDGYCWSDLKKLQKQQTVLYTLERILYNWNCYDGQPGIPTGSGRMFDLTVSSPVVPTHLAINNWISKNMVIYSLGNAKKTPDGLQSSLSMTSYLDRLCMESVRQTGSHETQQDEEEEQACQDMDHRMSDRSEEQQPSTEFPPFFIADDVVSSYPLPRPLSSPPALSISLPRARLSPSSSCSDSEARKKAKRRSERDGLILPNRSRSGR